MRKGPHLFGEAARPELDEAALTGADRGHYNPVNRSGLKRTLWKQKEPITERGWRALPGPVTGRSRRPPSRRLSRRQCPRKDRPRSRKDLRDTGSGLFPLESMSVVSVATNVKPLS